MDRQSENGSPERQKELIEQLKRNSMVPWKHFNLHEYDFSNEKMEDSVSLEKTPQKLKLSGV